MFETGIFYAFAAVLLLSGVRVITARNPVHAALFSPSSPRPASGCCCAPSSSP